MPGTREKAGQVSLPGFFLQTDEHAATGDRRYPAYIMPPIPPMPWS